MSDAIKVLVVDDDTQVCNLLREALSLSYTCEEAHSGQEAIKMAYDFRPQVILMDINMPDMDGFEACRAIKSGELADSCAIFLISGHNTLDMRLKAFDIGGDDFIAKPFQIQELLRKVQRVAEYITTRQNLAASEKESRSLAMSSMQQASHYSYVMNFFKSLNHTLVIDEIVSVFFDAMSFFGLHASIMIKQDTAKYFDPIHNKISPIETKIYELLADKGRIYEFGQRLLINDKHVSFLIKNMPDDQEKIGQIRDFTAAMVEGIEAKLEDLALRDAMANVIYKLKNSIDEVRNAVKQHESLVTEIMNDMISEIAASFHTLDMTEEQETFFSQLIETKTAKLVTVEDVLLVIQQQLTDLMEHTDKFVNHSNAEPQSSAKTPHNEVELFQ